MDTPTPHCVGFIMDGNRRYARERGEAAAAGHHAGKDTFLDVVQWVREANIPHAVFYGFSTENWHRSEGEVEQLMRLFESFIRQMIKDMPKEQIRVRIIGRRSDFSDTLQSLMAEVEAITAPYSGTTIWVALSYGGRAEILAAVNQAVAAGQPVDEANFSALLWSAEMPDPDCIIRTGGEQRLSNFLTWQSVYSELFFTDTYWPAFTKAEFLRIVEAYGQRQRRRGA